MAECRPGCGACCVVISISSSIPGMWRGKPAGVRCVNLNEGNHCLIYGTPEYPPVCAAFRASDEMCGASYEDAARYLERLERETAPDRH